MLSRYSSRRHRLGEQFLNEKLRDAVSYDRIAGYYCSSILEVAGEALEAVAGAVRVICNSGISPADVKVAGLAGMRMKQEWCEFSPEEEYAFPAAARRMQRLFDILSSGKLEIRVLPDEIYGLMHGKAGVITYSDGRRNSFIGSINETKSAFTTNYEMIWEDTGSDSADWVQEEFDSFWNNPHAVPLSDFVISDIGRIAGRARIPLKDWRECGEPQIGPVAVEEPIYRNEFGLWPHQRYFVARAFEEHKQKGGARLLLADMVGLGKTVQLAMAAKLMALYGDRPVLIIAPKTLLFQWQDELKGLLDMPSAVWTGKCWTDENGFSYAAGGAEGILECPCRVGIISQGLITRGSKASGLLKKLEYECVIMDEAHRARRKNTGQNPDNHKARPNKLLSFLREISYQTHSLLLATATPVQIDPIEVYDLLEALSGPTEKVLGDKHSIWRKTPQTGIDYITGSKPPPTAEPEMWQLIRNPFPQRSENNRRISTLRSQLEIQDDVYVLPQDMHMGLSPSKKNKIRELYTDDGFIQKYNPYIRCIVRRTRDFLENTINRETGMPYLKKTDVKLFGEEAAEALELSGYLKEAYDIAGEFCSMLSGRVKGGGFMSTLLLRRIGSTMLAGENTAKKMLSWASGGADGLQELCETEFGEDDEGDEPGGVIRQLTSEETGCLERLAAILAHNRGTDPKYRRLLSILISGTGNGEGPWKDKGCIVFSQYFDSANYVARLLSADIPDVAIGLYAGGDKSGVYKNGVFMKKSKGELKAMVKGRQLSILIGTDAASEGLNLQMLSTLINLDLPWNPTRLEQRKGRIQRIGQMADTIYIYNMRYKDSVEDKVHSMLSSRLQGVYSIFGQIPEVLEDVWIAVAQNDVRAATEAISKVPQKNPFVLKYETAVQDSGDWGKCKVVLDKEDKRKELMRGWKA